jgi:hypothetical protein
MYILKNLGNPVNKKARLLKEVLRGNTRQQAAQIETAGKSQE